MTRTLTTIFAVSLGLFALGFALAALLSEREQMREWNTQSNGRHTPIQNDTPQSLTRECQRGQDSRERPLRTNASDVLRKKLWKSNESPVARSGCAPRGLIAEVAGSNPARVTSFGDSHPLASPHSLTRCHGRGSIPRDATEPLRRSPTPSLRCDARYFWRLA